MDPVVLETKNKMQRAYDILRQDFATIRTGKASPSLIENIVIAAYGGTQKLKVMELATINAMDSQTLVITPFDQSIIFEIERGIADAGVNLNPIIDKNILRITLPPLTEERRREFVKLVNQKAENGRIMVRQVRHEAMDEIKKMDNSNTVSEDEVTRIEKEIQRLTDGFIEKMDTLRTEKEEELMKV